MISRWRGNPANAGSDIVENKFIQFNTNTDLVCTNDQTIISGEDNTIFNIYLKKG